jgi:hypothetical protein
MILKSETVGFVRGGMLFLEPPPRWRVWQRDVWTCCQAHHPQCAWCDDPLVDPDDAFCDACVESLTVAKLER